MVAKGKITVEDGKVLSEELKRDMQEKTTEATSEIITKLDNMNPLTKEDFRVMFEEANKSTLEEINKLKTKIEKNFGGGQMAVKIRLKRMGSNKKPFYRIVVADSRAPRDGRFIEEIGYYNPVSEPKQIKINDEKAKKWLGVGAQPTETVKKLLQSQEIIAK